jgi:molybdate transport system permease protein
VTLSTDARREHRRRVGGERLPMLVLVVAVVGIAFVALPFVGLLWKVPWSSAWTILTTSGSLRALRVSLVCSSWATALAVLFGVPIAWLLARVPFPGRGLVRALCTLSMVLPPVVAGVALFYALGRRGLVGQYLDRLFGLTLPFTTAGVVVAQAFVAMPFLVLTVEASFRQHDVRFEDAARTLGASRWYVFRRVTLPAIRPGLVWHGRVRSVSSAPRSRSPATSPAAPRRCRSPSTSRTRRTPTRRSCSASC